MSDIQPLPGYVWVRRGVPEQQTASGLWIPPSRGFEGCGVVLSSSVLGILQGDVIWYEYGDLDYPTYLDATRQPFTAVPGEAVMAIQHDGDLRLVQGVSLVSAEVDRWGLATSRWAVIHGALEGHLVAVQVPRLQVRLNGQLLIRDSAIVATVDDADRAAIGG